MNSGFFKNNRQGLVKALGGQLIVLSAYSRLQRSNDMAHSFSQEANFWYLTGIDEPDWLVIIDGVQNKSWLVMPRISDVHMTFDGGLSAEQAKQISGVDSVISKDESIKLLRTLAKRHSLVHTVGMPPHAEYFNFNVNPSILQNKNNLERIFNQVQDVQKELAKLRAIKQPEELAMMQKAINLTIEGFNDVRSKVNTYKHEYEIEADFNSKFRRAGSKGHAYDPIVASGMNACTLHHSHNNSKLSNRQLVLMDIGAEYGGYAADITRTYAKGQATKRQIAVHAAVEAAHKQIISLIAPSVLIEDYQLSVNSIMKGAIASLGLGNNEDSLRRYFPHAISHGLGIDVHDSLGSPRYFSENMVLTVEPGIYIPEEGIGVRIEDDIAVTAKGRKNLSGSLSTEL